MRSILGGAIGAYGYNIVILLLYIRYLIVTFIVYNPLLPLLGHMLLSLCGMWDCNSIHARLKNCVFSKNFKYFCDLCPAKLKTTKYAITIEL